MNDIETLVFNAVYDDVAPLCAKNGFTSVFVPNPSKFPCANLIEISNITDQRRNSTAEYEDFSIVSYQCEIYAMSKRECRQIAKAMDDAMQRIRFHC